jgi:hypothetical protein
LNVTVGFKVPGWGILTEQGEGSYELVPFFRSSLIN